ncbi:MAG: DUF3565 domain-containing protein, partial [Myxococcales bacterium]|nr:DUF3565 domain-containing protein [Myxococcales bacterium]
IVGLRREGPRAVVLALDCGHHRHVRHRPPLQVHPWVLDEAAARQRVGQGIECLRCGQRQLPEGSVSYRRTADFDEHTVPAGLLAAHRTRAGVWGRLWLVFEAPWGERVQVEPGAPAVIPAAVPHHVEPCGPVCFHVEFLRPPAADG